MQLRTRIVSALGALGLAAAAFYAPAASADRVGFSLSVGGPGYAVSVGNYGYGYYDHWRPAPVVVAPYAPYYGTYYPRPVVVAPPVVYRPYPAYRAYYRDGWRGHRHGGWRDGHRHDRHDRHDGHRGGHRHRDR
jgi:hypothetical protein